MSVSPSSRLAILLGAALVAAGSLLSACTDTVYRERPFFQQPPQGAAGFLGYDEDTTKLTVCGNCHVGIQALWENSAHASAWADLQASGHAQATCENCHTVGPNGNPTSGDVGWAATGDARYHDVQCESCHGPGSTHVDNPDATQPIPSLAVPKDPTTATNGCAECHNGSHHPFVEQWALAGHSNVNSRALAVGGSCLSCHTGQGRLAAWGVTGPYLEENSSTPLPIVCGVCHNPHGSPNTAQLRYPIETTNIEDHLCAQCHNRSSNPTPTEHGLSPMAPEAQLLEGAAGYFPPNVDFGAGQIVATHGSTGNPTLCATCHVVGFQATDTTGTAFTAVGHTFNAIPCLSGPGGIPTGNVDCPLTTDARNWKGCTASGCHGDANAALSALTTRLLVVKSRSDTLRAMLARVDPNGEDSGGAIDPFNDTLTVAEGAYFNLNLANWTGEVNGLADTSRVGLIGSTVHNPFLITALLDASILAVQSTYPAAASPTSPASAAELQAEIRSARQNAGVH